jgi:hypothetical protein
MAPSGGRNNPRSGPHCAHAENVIPAVACPSDDDLLFSVISPEAAQLADVVIRIARLLNAHERDMLDPEQ